MSKILVAEDERGTRLIVKQLLEKEGHEVIEAANGNAAYELATSEVPDVGVLDVKMPGMDGFEVLRKLKANAVTEGMPIVMLTGVPVEKGESTAVNFGASYYLPKPLDPKMLKIAVRSALRESASRDPSRDNGGAEKGAYSDVMDEITRVSESSNFARTASERTYSGNGIGVGDAMLDQKLGGGIPPGSLSLIEGESSAGKSVLCQHLAFSSLRKGNCVAYMTFEDTTQGLISKMDSLGLDVSGDFEMNRLRIYPLEEPSAYSEPERVMMLMVEAMEAFPPEFTTIVLDAITNVAYYCDDKTIMRFFAGCKKICKQGKTIILVAHCHAFDEKLLVRVGSLCDVHLKMRVDNMGPKLAKTLEVCKVHKAEMDTGNIVAFEIHPGIGMRINPISKFSI